MKKRLICLLLLTSICIFACGKAVNKDNDDNSETVETGNEKSEQFVVSSSDVRPIEDIEDMLNMSDIVINAKIEKRTEEELTTRYELAVNEWYKGNLEDNTVILKADKGNNDKTGYSPDYIYYDFKEGETYLFFLALSSDDNCYHIVGRNTGLIKIDSDNNVTIHESDLVFKECKNYDDVKRIIENGVNGTKE